MTAAMAGLLATLDRAIAQRPEAQGPSGDGGQRLAWQLAMEQQQLASWFNGPLPVQPLEWQPPSQPSEAMSRAAPDDPPPLSAHDTTPPSRMMTSGGDAGHAAALGDAGPRLGREAAPPYIPPCIDWSLANDTNPAPSTWPAAPVAAMVNGDVAVSRQGCTTPTGVVPDTTSNAFIASEWAMPAESPLVHQATTPPVWRGSALMQVLTQALIDAGLSTDVSSMDEATSPAPRGSPAGGQAPSMAPPPVRLHCQWQTGVLTVWIGHDQGQEAAVGLLVHSLQKWCVIERQSLPKVVVNGSRWERHFDADAPAADRDQVFHFYPSPPRPYLETC